LEHLLGGIHQGLQLQKVSREAVIFIPLLFRVCNFMDLFTAKEGNEVKLSISTSQKFLD
jgi:hypothetical protein